MRTVVVGLLALIILSNGILVLLRLLLIVRRVNINITAGDDDILVAWWELGRLGQLPPLLVSCRVLLDLLSSLLLRLLQPLLERLLLQYPIIHEVKIEAFAHERLSKHRYYLLVIRPLFKF